MRSDARKHRETLVAAAAHVFTRHGVDVPLQMVVDEANLGRATLYRHFRDREALIAAVIEQAYAHAEEIIAKWRDSPLLLRHFIRFAAQLRPSLVNLPDNVDVERVTELVADVRPKFFALQRTVVTNAIASGVVDPDFGAPELEMAIRMVSAGLDDPALDRDVALDRALDIVLAGLAGT